MHLTIWHNHKCSTSRKALEYLNAKGYKVEIRDYLSEPPSTKELQEILVRLGQKADYILRKKDKVFQEKFAHKALSDEEWMDAMHQNPSMIERPIVISESRAWLARPFEKWAEEFTP